MLISPPGRTLDLAAEYRVHVVQCLVNSDYTKSSIYTIETLILYVHGEYNARWDAEVGIWVIVGIIVRLAMRMGYHREPSRFPDVTPFQGEMRRRIWTFIRQIDTTFSFQLSLPSMIRSTDCDSQLPRNIHEDEFGPDSKILPPARPFTEPTPISYIITKAMISQEFGGILEQITALTGKPISYDEILRRDNRLRDLKLNMPPHLRLRPLEECTHDPATLLMQRFNLDIFWQKTMCVLHRKYIARARQNVKYAHSRRACVDASLEILRHQTALYKESQPGGRMRTMKWFISSLTKHDFLLAAMIVSLDLNWDRETAQLSEQPAGYDQYFWSPAQRAEMLQALETSSIIWKESTEASIESYKAYQILNIIIQKIKAPKAPPPQPKDVPPSAEVFSTGFNEEDLRPEHSAAMSLGMLSGGLTPNSVAYLNSITQSPGGTRYAGMDTGMSMGDSSSGGGTGMGMTPNYSGTAMDGSAANPFPNLGVASPFSAFVGSGSNTGVLDIPANLDWVGYFFPLEMS